MLDNWLEFDEMLKLAKKDPSSLENWRLNQIEKIIADAPESFQRRLRGLQFRIDCERQLHSTPMGTCLAISRMMHESLGRLNETLLGTHDDQLQEESAQILSFPVNA